LYSYVAAAAAAAATLEHHASGGDLAVAGTEVDAVNTAPWVGLALPGCVIGYMYRTGTGWHQSMYFYHTPF
jgi:hypothetical protein